MTDGHDRRTVVVRAAGQAIVVVIVLAIFYLVPVTGRDAGPTVRLIVGALAFAGLTTLIVATLRRDDDPIGKLVTVLIVVVGAFALAFYALAVTSTDQFSGLVTRTDALYFTVVTFTTIGYGDIHPVGQLAKLLVIAAIGFDLVFVTSLASMITSRLKSRRD